MICQESSLFSENSVHESAQREFSEQVCIFIGIVNSVRNLDEACLPIRNLLVKYFGHNDVSRLLLLLTEVFAYAH
jgi:hypothetical protein